MSGTTSGTYVYNQPTIKIISGALRLCGVIGDEETPTSPQLSNALDTLNAMIKGWSASQIHVWCEQECILFLNGGQAQYQLGPGSPDFACLYQDYTGTSLATTAATGATSVVVESATNLLAGDNFCVQLDSGVNFWTTISGVPAGTTVALTAPLPSQATSGALCFDYTTQLMRPLRAPEGRRFIYASQIENPLIVMSRFDYDYLPNKANKGTVTQFFYDPQQGRGAYSSSLGLMNAWPTPQDNTNAIRFVAQRAIQDINSLADNVDFPAEWLAALRWNLAVEMAPEFDVPADRYSVLKGKADEWFLRASSWDKEPESVFFGFASQPGYR